MILSGAATMARRANSAALRRPRAPSGAVAVTSDEPTRRPDSDRDEWDPRLVASAFARYRVAMATIVLVEDDPTIAEPLTRALAREGYTVEAYGTGIGGVEASERADLIILDLGLPDIDGIEVARRVRDKGLTVPILMLTARVDEVDLVVGLDAGADDYVTKPFRLAELLARVRALLRRRVSVDGASDLEVNGIRMDVAGHRAFADGRELQLSGKEFDLLHVLVANAGTVVSREALMRDVWTADAGAPSKTLDMHVSWLRRKLGDDANDPRFITTVRGLGFRFETGVE